MAKRIALGKGLDALIPEVTPAAEGGKLLEIDLDRIEPNPHQPRMRFGRESLSELAASIKAQGIVQPLVVRRAGAGFQIVVGERRWRAARMAGLRSVPALLHDTEDADTLELALVENIHREDLNPIEEASAYRMLIDLRGLTQKQVAERVGRKRSTVANMLRLLRLHDSVKNRILEGSIDMGHARALLALGDLDAQRDLCELTVRRGLSVRQVERRVRRILVGRRAARPSPPKDVFLKDAERRLSESLEAPVTIRPGRQAGSEGGKIEISYFSDADLQRLFDRLFGQGWVGVAE